MVISLNQREQILELLIVKITNKLKNPKSEKAFMPFHYRLIGKDRMALFRLFIQLIL